MVQMGISKEKIEESYGQNLIGFINLRSYEPLIGTLALTKDGKPLNISEEEFDRLKVNNHQSKQSQ